jgi:cell division protein FtsB
MAAHAHAGSATAHRARRRPAARKRPGARRSASRVNWERVGRIALTLVLAAVLYSYLNPAINFVKTYTATTGAKAQLHEVQLENTRLHRRIQDSSDPIVIDREARAQGMVAPGETPIVLDGLHS